MANNNSDGTEKRNGSILMHIRNRHVVSGRRPSHLPIAQPVTIVKPFPLSDSFVSGQSVEQQPPGQPDLLLLPIVRPSPSHQSVQLRQGLQEQCEKEQEVLHEQEHQHEPPLPQQQEHQEQKSSLLFSVPSSPPPPALEDQEAHYPNMFSSPASPPPSPPKEFQQSNSTPITVFSSAPRSTAVNTISLSETLGSPPETRSFPGSPSVAVAADSPTLFFPTQTRGPSRPPHGSPRRRSRREHGTDEKVAEPAHIEVDFIDLTTDVTSECVRVTSTKNKSPAQSRLSARDGSKPAPSAADGIVDLTGESSSPKQHAAASKTAATAEPPGPGQTSRTGNTVTGGKGVDCGGDDDDNGDLPAIVLERLITNSEARQNRLKKLVRMAEEAFSAMVADGGEEVRYEARTGTADEVAVLMQIGRVMGARVHHAKPLGVVVMTMERGELVLVSRAALLRVARRAAESELNKSMGNAASTGWGMAGAAPASGVAIEVTRSRGLSKRRREKQNQGRGSTSRGIEELGSKRKRTTAVASAAAASTDDDEVVVIADDTPEERRSAAQREQRRAASARAEQQRARLLTQLHGLPEDWEDGVSAVVPRARTIVTAGDEDEDNEGRRDESPERYIGRHGHDHNKGKELTPTEASAEPPRLDQRNKGFAMLRRMGWREGDGLGRDNNGARSPPQTVRRRGGMGIGYRPQSSQRLTVHRSRMSTSR